MKRWRSQRVSPYLKKGELYDQVNDSNTWTIS